MNDIAGKSRIKGITIELEGKTTGLEKAISDVTSKSMDLQGELRDVERLLKFDPGNVEALAQKQEILTKQLENTTEKLNRLKAAQEEVEKQFNSGEIGEKQYRAFRREIEYTEKSISNLKEKLAKVNGEDIKEVTEEVIDLQGELKEVEKLLKFDPGNVEALAQKQELLQKQLEGSTKQLKELRDTQSEVENQFKNGDIGESKYRAFRRQIEFAEKSVKDLENEISQLDGSEVQELITDFNRVEESSDDAKESVKELGSQLLDLAAGAAAVVGIGEVIEKSLEVSSANTKIDITFDVPEESKQSIKEAINSVTAYGVDAEEALEGVRRQWALNKDATDESNASVIKSAGAIAAAYNEIDFTELIQESNEMASSMDMSNEEALAMVNSLLKIGFPPDQLDIIAEYGSQLARAGFSAQEIQAIMAEGVETGTWNIDVLLDGLKEGRIVLAEFGQGVDDETSKLFEKIGISGKQLEEWGQAVADGGEKGSVAFQNVAEALSKCEDKTLQNQLGTTIFGTLWEENGTKVTDAILGMNDNLTTAKENQDELNQAIETLDSDPAIAMQQAMLDLQLALQPLLGFIAELIGYIAQWIKDNPTLAATITAVLTVLGILMGLFIALAQIITTLTGLSAALGVGIGTIALPVLAVIAAIAALIAIGVLLYKNWDEIKAKSIEIWESIKNFFSETWSNIKEIFSNGLEIVKSYVKEKFSNIKESISGKMKEVKDTISNIWNSVMDFFKNINLFDIGKNIIQGLINGIKNMASSVVESVKGVVNGAIQGAKKLLGIHSPSRVFKQFGVYTGEGFVNGITEMKDEVARAGQRMADASIPNIVAPDFSSNGSLESNQINVYLTNETKLDSKTLGKETKNLVVNGVGRSTKNYMVKKGRVKFA